MHTTAVATVIFGVLFVPGAAFAQRCDPSIPGNSRILNPANCLARAAERDGIVMGLSAQSKQRIDPSKVPACTAIGARLMRRMSVRQEDYIATSTFASTFTFSSQCARIALECQVLETGNQPVLNKAPWGTISMKCGASADRYAEALLIIVPSAPAAKVTAFATRCLAAARAKKNEGPTDLEVGTHLLTCDPQHPEGPEVSIQPNN